MKLLKTILVFCCIGCTVLFASSVLADVKTVTFDVDKMSCESCPYIVKKAIGKLDGVVNVDVSFENKSATVTYDDEKVEIAAIESATRDAGFPTTLAK